VRDRESKSFQSILRLPLDKDLTFESFDALIWVSLCKIDLNNMNWQRTFLAWNVTENGDFSREFV
jgi:hypothetical protein